MRLSSLEIQGFKSFPDKTRIEFDKGMTVVVGPNGSGKSNISDAMRWVLGEQSTKTLRGGKMEDVIFAGTSARKPMGSACVSLTFDNTDRTLPADADTVTITRRYYRSGESEYLLNNKAIRLRELNEMLMDTGLGKDGYSMIGQGRIAEIIAAKNRERREIFEEAAGIAKYRYRREEAERKLTQAQENLLRLYDILSELEGRVEPLREQSEKAAQFLALSDEKKGLEVTLWLMNMDQFRTSLSEQEEKCRIARGDAQRLEEQATEIEQSIQSAFQKTQDCLTRSEEYRALRENLQNRIANNRSDIAVDENERTHSLLEQKRIREEIDRSDAASGQRAAAILSAREDCKRLEGELTQLSEKEQALTGTRDALLKKGKSYDSEAGDLQAKISELTLSISRNGLLLSSGARASEEERARLSEAESGLSLSEEKIREQLSEAEEVSGLLSEIIERKESLQNTLSGYQLKLSGKQENLQKLQQQYQNLELEEKGKLQRAKLLHDLEENLEGFAHSVKAVMSWQKNGRQKGIHGTVAQLMEVPEKYALAVETALGGGLQNIVVADENTAKSCIRSLQREKAGRATFLPLTSVKGTLLSQPGLEKEPGVIGIASELVGTDPAYQGVIRFLLGRIVIVSDLDTASELAKKNHYRFRIVTLDGQQINVGGSFTGGSAARSQGILSRRGEAATLKTEAESIRKQKESVAEEGKKLRAQLSELNAQIEGVRSEMIVAGEDSVRFEGEKKHCEAEIASAKGRAEEYRAQITQIKEKLSLSLSQQKQAESDLAAARTEKEALEEKLSARQDRQDALSADLEKTSEELSALSIRRVVLEKDLEAAKERESMLGKERETAAEAKRILTGQAETLEQTVRSLESAMRRMKKEIEEFNAQATEYEKKNEALLQRRTELERETLTLRQKARDASALKERAAGELARLDEQKQTIQRDYDRLVSRLWEEYELTPREADHLRIQLESVSEGNRQLGILKNRIKALGSINVAAIEEYKEVSARYSFLKTQVDDAASARDELLQLIENLTGEMKEIFGTAFKMINKNFGEIFSELFGGGNASLRLEDPEDILECGIEIIVQPPGKIIKNLAALSGGEQTMVAVAIYLAILKVRPSPFCVLDEIEAALDDVNVSRYAAYLRSICDKTQFILITHRRGTMEQADVLYGVTMQESGVSKLLELKISQLAPGDYETQSGKT